MDKHANCYQSQISVVKVETTSKPWPMVISTMCFGLVESLHSHRKCFRSGLCCGPDIFSLSLQMSHILVEQAVASSQYSELECLYLTERALGNIPRHHTHWQSWTD